VHRSENDRDREVAGTGEFKAVAREAVRLGTRVLDKGRAWLTKKANEMTHHGDRDYEQPRYRSSDNQGGGRDSRTQGARGRTGDSEYSDEYGRGWQDDRGDAPGQSQGYRGAGRFPQQGGPNRGYYAYGEASGGGRARSEQDQDKFGSGRGGDEDRQGSQRGGDGDWLRSQRRDLGEGYGRSIGYADRSGFAGSAYGSGFEPNPGSGDYSQGAQSGYRGERAQASHRGRGPRGYSRSDERIAEDLNERLTDDDLIDASDIELRCSEGKVTLEGEVATRWMKHRAEDLVDACNGVKEIDNRLRVRGGRVGSAMSGARDEHEQSGTSARSNVGTSAGTASESNFDSGVGADATSPGGSSTGGTGARTGANIRSTSANTGNGSNATGNHASNNNAANTDNTSSPGGSPQSH
jgi:hypothetical protein